MSVNRDMSFSMTLGDATVYLSAEGVSWSPDVAVDMATRGILSMRELVKMAIELGVPTADDDDFDDDDIEEVLGDDGRL